MHYMLQSCVQVNNVRLVEEMATALLETQGKIRNGINLTQVY